MWRHLLLGLDVAAVTTMLLLWERDDATPSGQRPDILDSIHPAGCSTSGLTVTVRNLRCSFIWNSQIYNKSLHFQFSFRFYRFSRLALWLVYVICI